ncbi:MAG: peptidase E [Actinomycetota bacterium]
MTERHIVAMGGGGFSMDDPALDRYVLGLTDRPRPRVCFLPSATGSVPTYILRFVDAFPSSGFETSFLDLFVRDDRDLRAFLLEQDVIYVGGGNTANLLAIWRAHGVDAILREAWEAGVVLTGVSAGANCWFEGSTTDSFGRLAALPDGLGLLSGSFSPHFDSEPERRPLFHQLVAEGTLPSGVGCDDFAAVHLVGTELSEVVASRERAGAYRIARSEGGDVREEALPVTRLIGAA